uniref:CWH43-like N-terminal domain-containing protein n=1 Tax=Hyaloperonospora arabidopsidis (strain Emoy2) TaxID=559515 RepID=M4B209_HYAAE
MGMSFTAVLIFVSISLFFWYLRLRTRQQRHNPSEKSRTQYVAVGYTCLMFGLVTALSLFGLAAMDMRTYHDAHIVFTVLFFISAWVMMIAVQVARTSTFHEDEGADVDGKMSKGESLFTVLQRRSFWTSLRRWRRLDFFTAYTLGRLLLCMGLASTFLSCFEAFAIVCQLLFMGTLSCELAHLVRLLEQSNFTASMESGRSE